MATFSEAEDLKQIAKHLIDRYDRLGHIELDEVLFFWEEETIPKALAKFYKFGDSPIGFFTDALYAVVVYRQNVDYMSPEQITMLIYHELMHHPFTDDKCVDHDVKDFRALLDINVGWADPGAEVPDLLADSA